LKSAHRLSVTKQSDPVALAPAKQIIQLAKQGERDPIRLRDQALTSFRLVIEVSSSAHSGNAGRATPHVHRPMSGRFLRSPSTKTLVRSCGNRSGGGGDQQFGQIEQSGGGSQRRMLAVSPGVSPASDIEGM